jgi:hypothetical protein
VGHRRVVRTRQDRPSEDRTAVVGSELLVQLPEPGCEQQRGDEQDDASHDFAATDSAIAGMTWSPYAWSVLSLPSCCRYTANWVDPEVAQFVQGGGRAPRRDRGCRTIDDLVGRTNEVWVLPACPCWL